MKKKMAGISLAVLLAAGMASGCGENLAKDGMEYLEEGNYEQAKSAFTEALKEDGEDPAAYRGLGFAKWELEDYEGALDNFQKALDNGGEKTAEIYNLMGSCAMKLDKASQALSYYRLGMEQEDVSGELMKEMRFNEIAAYEKTGDMKSAKKKLESYTKDYPEDEKAAKEAEFLETR